MSPAPRRALMAMAGETVTKERVAMSGTTPPPLARPGAWRSSGPPAC